MLSHVTRQTLAAAIRPYTRALIVSIDAAQRELDADLALLANDNLCMACKIDECDTAESYLCAECRAERGR